MINDNTSFADLWAKALSYKWYAIAAGVAFVIGLIAGAAL